ncbi:protein FIP1 [Citrus sinensis]|uniref:Protein FIP1 n=1 Tax=Citrus sinensis TaxID=2711 RepID=A0ACB8P3I6_CITSI|nr:protein FIP1 [Citrus sinensis]
MSTERHASSSTSASPEENAMFLDILHEAPLLGHRKSHSIFGSVVYCFVLAGYAILAAGTTWIFHPIHYLIPPLLCSCDVILLALTGYVHQYNSLNSQPDVMKSLYSPLQPSSSLEGLRYHDGGRLSDEQMALLQYQRENLHFLSEEILRLQECLSKYEQSDDGSTPQVDLAHLLAARDQELRTLSAEMNQLQSELRLARSLIAEREAEVLRVRNTNNQVFSSSIFL